MSYGQDLEALDPDEQDVEGMTEGQRAEHLACHEMFMTHLVGCPHCKLSVRIVVAEGMLRVGMWDLSTDQDVHGIEMTILTSTTVIQFEEVFADLYERLRHGSILDPSSFRTVKSPGLEERIRETIRKLAKKKEVQ